MNKKNNELKTPASRFKHTDLLGNEKISKLLIHYSLPAVVGMMVNALYNFVDSIFISRTVGPSGMASVTISFPIVIITMAFAMLIGIGSTSLLSLRLGEGKHDEAEKIIGNGLTLLILIALAFTGIGLVFLVPLLELIGGTQATLAYAKDYLSIILLGNVFMSIGFGMNNYIRAEGNPLIAMLTMIIGAILNVLLDYIFIVKLGMGIKGAALATIISQSVSAIWVLSYFLGGRSTLKIHLSNMVPQFLIVKKIVTLGLAPFAIQLASSVLNITINITIKKYAGVVDASAYQGAMGAIFRINLLLLLPVVGISQGVQPIIGYNYGAKKYGRVKQTLKLGIITATVIATSGYLISRIFPQQLIGMFVDKNANYKIDTFVHFGKIAIKYFYFAMPIIGFQIIGSNYFQAVGKPIKAGLLTLSRQLLIILPLILIFPIFFGINGIVYSIPVADVTSALLTFLFLVYEIRHLKISQQYEDNNV